MYGVTLVCDEIFVGFGVEKWLGSLFGHNSRYHLYENSKETGNNMVERKKENKRKRRNARNIIKLYFTLFFCNFE